MKTALIFFPVFLLLGACSSPNNYRVSVSVADTQAGGKYVLASKDMANGFSDTLVLKKAGETITFTKPFTEPGFMILTYIQPGEKKPITGTDRIFIDTVGTIRVTADSLRGLPCASMEGGVFEGTTMRSLDSLYKSCYRTVVEEIRELDKVKTDSLIREIYRIQADIATAKRQYAAAHPRSIYSAALLAETLSDSLEVAERIYATFSPEVKASRYGKIISERIKIQPNRPAMDITLTDIEGNELILADYHGKWVILDFWGSWCKPCRNSNPALVELYGKYKDKGLEIIGFAARDKLEKLKAAIAEDGLTWPQVNLSDTGNENGILAKFNISLFPTKILVDPQGNISVISRGYHKTADPVIRKVTEELNK